MNKVKLQKIIWECDKAIYDEQKDGEKLIITPKLIKDILEAILEK